MKNHRRIFLGENQENGRVSKKYETERVMGVGIQTRGDSKVESNNNY